MPDIGVLTEQGFVIGNGLGFNPISEADQKKLEPSEEKENK